MNHLPYKEWLLSEATLTDEQADALEEHLHSCEACRQIEPAWIDVQALFQKTPAAEPSPGFTARWQIRLEKHQQGKQRRLAWIILGIMAGMAAALSALVGLQIIEVVNAPGNILLLLVSRLTNVLSIFWEIGNFYNDLTAHLPSMTILMLIFGVGMISFLSVLWLAAYRKLTLVRRLA